MTAVDSVPPSGVTLALSRSSTPGWPELDEPITDLDIVETCTVSDEGVATVGLRLPTFFCAPDFSS